MDGEKVAALVANGSDPAMLDKAKRFAGNFVWGDPRKQTNTCAATLSFLLDQSGIDVGVEDAVVALAATLESKRGWGRINDLTEPQIGDIGVFAYDAQGFDEGIHHIYLVIGTPDPASPLVADNQGAGSHQRPVNGGAMAGIKTIASPTNYFLRAT